MSLDPAAGWHPATQVTNVSNLPHKSHSTLSPRHPAHSATLSSLHLLCVAFLRAFCGEVTLSFVTTLLYNQISASAFRSPRCISRKSTSLDAPFSAASPPRSPSPCSIPCSPPNPRHP